MLDAIGVSLVDHVPQELLFLSFKQLRLAYGESLLDQTLECTVRDMQCDNQMQAAPFPVLFAPTREAAATATAEAPATAADVLHVSVLRSKQHTKIVYIKYLSALLRECDLSVDELLLLAVSRLVTRYTSALQQQQQQSSAGAVAETSSSSPDSGDGFATTDMQVVYIKLLHLNPIKLL
jgi:hypothetical protein